MTTLEELGYDVYLIRQIFSADEGGQESALGSLSGLSFDDLLITGPIYTKSYSFANMPNTIGMSNYLYPGIT